jgi:two-component system, sensor histidine kinase and response regulator
MKFLQQRLVHSSPSTGTFKSSDHSKDINTYFKKIFLHLWEKIKSLGMAEKVDAVNAGMTRLLGRIKDIGLVETMEDYEKRKLGIFNKLNFFQLVAGILVPVCGLFNHEQIPLMAWLIASLPAFISILVLWLNAHYRYEAGMIAYFILYPVITSIVYMSGMNLGVELFFILYGILSVFFLQQISHMLFSVALSMISYFMLSVVWKTYHYQLASVNIILYFFNQVLAIAFIFVGLFLIKKENNGYQLNILNKNRDLHKKNLEIEKQKLEIAQNAELLQKQTAELTELNTVKNKLFSVIAHDLRSPIYALRNLFINMEQYNLPAEEIKLMIPDVVKDFNYTTGLMENLLQWARTQMQAHAIKQQAMDVSSLIGDTMKLLRLQAETKHIYMERKIEAPVYVFADKDMINLVLRNLLSNAIKFTPDEGCITIGVNEMPSCVEIFVQDTGMGISQEAMLKINENDYYTTRGTASEPGTGLGLMLCKEFLARNGGHMHIESEPGKGSVFSFTLPKPSKTEIDNLKI